MTSAHPPEPATNNVSSPDRRRSLEESAGGEKRQGLSDGVSGRKSTDEGGERKRRSGKASALLASARNSLHLPGSSSPSQSHSRSSSVESAEGDQTPLQKLGRQDPARTAPQGCHNNSAGESLPGARSTFHVGVTEDRNKKCRRTMEDTHSYLYNFLNTPAPTLTTGGSAKESAEPASPTSAAQDSSASAPNVVETDNGYFAIFDGHAGTFAADWCGKKLHGILEDAVKQNPNTPIPELLDQTFTTVDHELERLPLKNSGCTAVIAVLRWEDRVPNSRSATGSSALAPAAAAAAAVKAVTDPSAATGFGSDALSNAAQAVTISTSNLVVSSSSSSSSHGTAKQQQADDHHSPATRQRVLYTANVGDARIVLCRNGKALRLSYDHKGSDENEGKRVANAGGLILNNRVNGVLAVTRALGDTYMKDLVTGHPYTTETVIQPDADEFIILACDGVSCGRHQIFLCIYTNSPLSKSSLIMRQLWDVCTDQEAVDLIRNVQDAQAASKVLVDHALSRFSTDNLSCMIVRFDSAALRHAVEHRIEPIGVEGDPPTHRGSLSEAEAIVLESKQKSRHLDPAHHHHHHHHHRHHHHHCLDPTKGEEKKEKEVGQIDSTVASSSSSASSSSNDTDAITSPAATSATSATSVTSADSKEFNVGGRGQPGMDS